MDYAAAFLDQNRAFGDVIGGADPATPVPTCPGWTFRQLLRHVGRGDRWAAQIITERVDHFLDPRAVEGGKPPDDPGGAISWLHGGAQRLIDAVEQVGVETPVWTFLGRRPAYWWIRRRLHETAVHRADAALALGLAYSLAAELAADGVSEWLERVAAQAGSEGAPPLEDGNSMHLHATDPGLGVAGEWTITAGNGRITWSHDHGKSTVALRGAATDLLLALARRISVADSGIAMFGDSAVWQNWLDRTPF
ncbi:MAG: maleylpyruvate isomerase N-terminal domain-containing protein [Mycobacterium sp.]|uniref:maleylpyruvate isomerase N-terminal domain-containing protein n=1 Tax=Mycobacterium sp. TaxID=1785 RepID=UPI002611949C|nr:maleylpyruvate isomerase N-terminal domain-containing protein [Mycobacterium sp.]MDI3315965.1 maleylpyruvate isomerase N-terminal domain-containing protein [Mycobacterium sp.]